MSPLLRMIPPWPSEQDTFTSTSVVLESPGEERVPLPPPAGESLRGGVMTEERATFLSLNDR